MAIVEKVVAERQCDRRSCAKPRLGAKRCAELDAGVDSQERSVHAIVTGVYKKTSALPDLCSPCVAIVRNAIARIRGSREWAEGQDAAVQK